MDSTKADEMLFESNTRNKKCMYIEIREPTVDAQHHLTFTNIESLPRKRICQWRPQLPRRLPFRATSQSHRCWLLAKPPDPGLPRPCTAPPPLALALPGAKLRRTVGPKSRNEPPFRVMPTFHPLSTSQGFPSRFPSFPFSLLDDVFSTSSSHHCS